MTKASQWAEKLTNNWHVKILCFIIAVILYIFHQSSLFQKKSFVLPVTIIQDGIVMPVGDYTKNVTVTVRANTENITSVHANQIKASINLTNITKNGEYHIPVNITVSPEIMTYDPFEIKVKPESIKINVEKTALRYVKVEPSIVGEPAHGYGISSVKIEPSFVEVFGPESIVQQFNGIVTDKIDISNKTKDESFQVSAKNISKILRVDNRGPYKVDVKIEPLMMEKSFSDYKVQGINLKSDFLLKTELPYARLTLSGTIPTLENFNLNAYSVQVDLASVNEAGKYELPVRYVYPSYFTLVEKSLDKVTVEIERKVVEPEPEEEPAENQETETTAEKEAEVQTSKEGIN